MTSTKEKTEVPAPPVCVLKHATVVDDRHWIPGYGKAPCRIMVVGDRPDEESEAAGLAMQGPALGHLMRELKKTQVDMSSTWYTLGVKFMPKAKNKNPSLKEKKACAPFLEAEMEACQPEYILCLGAVAAEMVTGEKHKITVSHGTTASSPIAPGAKVFITYNPNAILYNPAAEPSFKRDVAKFSSLISGGGMYRPEKVDITEVVSVDALRPILLDLASKDAALVSLDAEWNGKHYMDPDLWIRTVQLGLDKNTAIVLKFYNQGGTMVFDGKREAYELLAGFFKLPNVHVIGHNAIADGEMLMSQGVDIRDAVTYDTMVVEHIINSAGPFNLTDMVMKYTNEGRYDTALKEWVNNHPEQTKHGYGYVPDSLLIPYAAKDVTTLFQVAEAQTREDMDVFLEPRGEYPSLFDGDHFTQRIMYELEMTGMNVDKRRLAELTDTYNAKLVEIESAVKARVADQFGWEGFNPGSYMDVSELLFQRMGLVPVKTTDHVPWERVANEPDEIQQQATPSTDRTTLEILQDKDDIIRLLRDYRKLSKVCSQWLVQEYDPEKHDETTKGGGIVSKIWPDGRLHAQFKHMTATGRFSTARPNMQNWPKRTEGDIARIFGAEACPPPLRSIITPTPGYVLLEGDWTQAEMFVTAWLSGDKNMWEALTTPGCDLHDRTTLTSFGIQMEGPDGTPVTERDLIRCADQYGVGAYKQLRDSLTYVNQRGERFDRAGFDLLRTSGKSINFGILYGRGAQAIAIQVKAETGTKRPVNEIAAEIQRGLDTWKNTLYVDAWRYMEKCADAVVNPGYLITPFNRVRRFPPTKVNSVLASFRREGMNHNIQGTVADLCIIAFYLLDKARKKHGLGFRFVNQIHDAILFEIPEWEYERTYEIIHETISSIRITQHGKEDLTIPLDFDRYVRWGEKYKKE